MEQPDPISEPGLVDPAGAGPPATRRPGLSSSARAGLVRTGTVGLSALRTVIPIAARLVSVLNVYSWIVVGASVVIAALIGIVARPVTAGSIIPYLLLIVALAVPCVALRLFHGALVEVLAMPEWLRTSPGVVKDHGAELAQIAAAAASHSRDRLTSVPGDIFRSGRLLMKAHGDLPEYGRLVRLINVPFLIVVLVSFLWGLFAIVFALMMIVTTPIALVLQ